jgi:hypothetical protein
LCAAPPLRLCHIHPRFCKPKDLDIIFVEVNIEENAKSDVGLMNPDRALMRFEFVDALMRVANRKFVLVSGGWWVGSGSSLSCAHAP